MVIGRSFLGSAVIGSAFIGNLNVCTGCQRARERAVTTDADNTATASATDPKER